MPEQEKCMKVNLQRKSVPWLRTGTDGTSPPNIILAKSKGNLGNNTNRENAVSAPQDNSGGFAIAADMRKQQLTLNIMRKHMVLDNKGKGHGREGAALRAKLEKTGVDAIEELEIK
eukprot:10008294-Heterocapsa_arctica.AAC.1